MATVNIQKLSRELQSAGIEIWGCNSNGIVWGRDNEEIQERPDVAAIIAVHDPTPEPKQSIDEQIRAMQAQLAELLKRIEETK